MPPQERHLNGDMKDEISGDSNQRVIGNKKKQVKVYKVAKYGL